VAALLGAVLLALYLRLPQHPLAVACDRINEGMPTEEAIAIVGRPPDSGGTEWHVSKRDPRGLQFSEWFGEDCKLKICSWEGRVDSKEYVSFHESFFGRCRRWLGL